MAVQTLQRFNHVTGQPVGDYVIRDVARGADVLKLDSTGIASIEAGLKERGRTEEMGEWTSVAFAAGNFTASGAMTWTVAAGDQVTYKYTLIGKTMILVFTIVTSTVGGVVADELRIAIPGGFTAAAEMANPVFILDNSVRTTGWARVLAAGAYVGIKRTDNANFTAATDATYVFGQLSFEVT